MVGFVCAFWSEKSLDAAVGDAGLGGDHGVAETGEVGACRSLADGVVEGGVFVKEGGGGRGEVTACGEAEDADFLRIEVVGFRVVANGLDGAEGVGEGDGVFELIGRRGLSAREAVAKDEGGDAALVEPAGDVAAFVFGGLDSVATAGADDDGRAFFTWIWVGGDERQEAGVMDVFDDFGTGGVLTVGNIRVDAGGVGWPERDVCECWRRGFSGEKNGQSEGAEGGEFAGHFLVGGCGFNKNEHARTCS